MKNSKTSRQRRVWMAVLAVAAATFALWGWAQRGRSALQPVPRNDPQWLARHQTISDRLKQGHADVLWIGDSIVEMFDGPGKPTWDHYYAPRNAVNMGISADQTQNVLWRLDRCNLECVSPRLAIVMIGQNNGPWYSADRIAQGVTAIVGKLRVKLPDTKILLLGIFYRGAVPSDEQVKLARTNAIISRLDDGRHVFYLCVNPIFQNPDGTINPALMPDLEHPNAQGCEVWAKAIEPKVAELFGQPPIQPEK